MCTTKRKFSRSWRKRESEKKKRIRLLTVHGCLILDRLSVFILQARKAHIHVNRINPTTQIISWKDIYEYLVIFPRTMSYKLKALGKMVNRRNQEFFPHATVIKFAPKCSNESCDSSASCSESSDCCTATDLKRKNSFGVGQVEKHQRKGDSGFRSVHFCSRCGYAFSDLASLKNHKCCSTPTSPCIVCGLHVPQNLYSDHVIGHDNDPLLKDLTDADMKCAYCLKAFSNKTTLLVHYRNHIAQFQCTTCKMHFLSAAQLKEHVGTEHQRVEHQPFHCYICSHRFTYQEAIVNHMRLHTGEMPFTCKECGRSFNQIGNLQRHINTHRGVRPHRCEECGSKFTDPATLRNHMRVHTGELPYVCDKCNRGFSQVGNLKRHMAKHISNEAFDRPFRCPECGEGFAHESTLRNHYRTHTGEQPYKCTMCGRAFSQIGNLKRHMAKHASMHDFLCGTCNRSFVSSTELVQHDCVSSEITLKDLLSIESETPGDCCMITPWPLNSAYPASPGNSSGRSSTRTSESSSCDTDASDTMGFKSGDNVTPSNSEDESSNGSTAANRKWRIFPCKVCGKVYTWQHDLKIHFRIHSGEKPYKCDICQKRFAQSGAIRTHKKRHHPNFNISLSEI